MTKVFYDSIANKEVYDISGTYTKQYCIDIYGMSAIENIQEVELISSDYAYEIINGVLQTFNATERTTNEAIAKETERAEKETSIKTTLGLTDQQFLDLKIAMGL